MKKFIISADRLGAEFFDTLQECVDYFNSINTIENGYDATPSSLFGRGYDEDQDGVLTYQDYFIDTLVAYKVKSKKYVTFCIEAIDTETFLKTELD
tara:strand:+ start:59 stop:346 length:288 start_codon:yes stop_codon:yes gene_type:complete